MPIRWGDSVECDAFELARIARSGFSGCAKKTNDTNPYSRLWLLSKYGTTGELFATLRDNSKVWVPHERLGRLAASFFPLFLNSSEEEHYKKLLADTLNARLRETLRARSPLRRRRVLAFALVVDALRLRNVRFEKEKGPPTHRGAPEPSRRRLRRRPESG